MLSFLLDVIFPSLCVGCGAECERGGVVCGACFSKIPINTTLFCGKCRARLPENKKVCHKNFPYLLGGAVNYGDPIARNLIAALKFRFIRSAADPLGEILFSYIKSVSIPLHNFLVVPVPLSEERGRERGFNQSLLIAKNISRHLDLPLITDVLVRERHEKPQSEMPDYEKRVTNVRGCFRVESDGLIHANILLVDDVTTSGATFYEASKSLKNAGARKIIALAVAKA